MSFAARKSDKYSALTEDLEDLNCRGIPVEAGFDIRAQNNPSYDFNLMTDESNNAMPTWPNSGNPFDTVPCTPQEEFDQRLTHAQHVNRKISVCSKLGLITTDGLN